MTTATPEQYATADELARAAMAIRPDLPQNQSLDEWLAAHGAKLTTAEYTVAAAALAYHPDYNPDFA